jgi:hypothetical protein
MKNCPRGPLPGLVAAVLLTTGVTACGDAEKAARSGPARSPTAARPTTAEMRDGYWHYDGDKDGDDPDSNQIGHTQDDQELLRSYGGPKHAPATTARAIEALVRRYYVVSLAGEASSACSLLAQEIVAGLIAEHGSSNHGAGACTTAIKSVLAQGHGHLAAENPATMRVTGVYVKGNLGLVMLGFKRFPESSIIVQRKGRAWKMDALFDNVVT